MFLLWWTYLASTFYTECTEAIADVVFVLDASSSEGRDNFMKQVYFVGNVTKSLPIGPDNIQVGWRYASSAFAMLAD